MKKLLAPIVLSAVLAGSAGCYGSYGAFHAVHKWNGHATGNRIADSAIHFLFWIPLPVYPLVIAGDWLIFNNVEFITGKPVFN